MYPGMAPAGRQAAHHRRSTPSPPYKKEYRPYMTSHKDRVD